MCNCAVARVGLLFILLFSTSYAAPNDDSEHDEAIPDEERVRNLNEHLTKQVSDFGFLLRTYEVLAEDDYILKIHRLSQKDVNTRRPPVLIMHGISACSANYLAYRKSLAYYLAERGYDVWLGNGRGNSFSMKHKDMVKMNPNKSEFWDFSFHEIGYFDIPAFLRKIKQVTDSDRVHYIGMSMGTTVFLVMASTRPSFQKDVASVSLLAPVACPKHLQQLQSKTNQFFIMTFYNVVRFIGRGDMYTYNKSIASALYTACKSKGWIGKMCEKYLRSRSVGKDQFDFDNSLETILFYPCGAAVKAFQHFIQMAQAERFQQFDYGKKGNQAKYKQDVPPEYDLSSINVKVHLLVGGEDTQADKRDIIWLHDRLPKGKSVYITNRFEHFDHRDFEYGIELEAVHETVLEVVEAHQEGRDAKLSYDVMLEPSKSEEIQIEDE